MMHGQTQIKS